MDSNSLAPGKAGTTLGMAGDVFARLEPPQGAPRSSARQARTDRSDRSVAFGP